MNILNHYKKLWFFNYNRLKDSNYQVMREYFAHILIDDIEAVTPLDNKKVLDVGGARGEFCKALNERKGCDCTNLDIEIKDPIWHKNVEASADNMPFADNEFDIVICRGVLEHIEPKRQQKSVNEIYRVLKPQGTAYIMIPPWYNPHAGHAFRPFHVFGFTVAKFLANSIYKKGIKENSFAEKDLYQITFSRMAKMIKESGFNIKTTKDVHFRLHFLTKIPLVREIAVPAVAFILVK